MHDSMQYDSIQGQGHEPFKVGNQAVFKSYLLRDLQWELATDHGFLNYGTLSKFDRAGSLKFSQFLCHVTLKLAEKSVVKSRPSVQYGANLFSALPRSSEWTWTTTHVHTENICYAANSHSELMYTTTLQCPGHFSLRVVNIIIIAVVIS